MAGEDSPQDSWSQEPESYQDQGTQTPPQGQGPQPPQGYQQPQQPHHPPRDFFKDLAKDKTMAMGALFGLVIIMVGAILLSATTSIDDPRHVITIGNILRDIGVFLLSGMMLIGAFYRDDWNKWIRIGMAGFALVLIVVGYFSIGLEFGATAGMGW